jgi:AraC-like DNA-binding protein
MEVGFSSLGSFSDLFTRRIGVPPSLYRRRAHAAPPGCLTLLGLLPEDAFRNSEEASRGAPGKIAASTRRTQRGNA